MSDESAYSDVKPKANKTLNLALAICFTGLFFMLAGVVAVVAFFAVGGKTIDTNFGYLTIISLYLGMIVVALIGAAYSFGPPEEEHGPMVVPIFRKRPKPD